MDKLSWRNSESYVSAISWLRTCTSFEILRSVITKCAVRVFHKNTDFLDDFSVNARNVGIFKFVLVDSIFTSWL